MEEQKETKIMNRELRGESRDWINKIENGINDSFKLLLQQIQKAKVMPRLKHHMTAQARYYVIANVHVSTPNTHFT